MQEWQLDNVAEVFVDVSAERLWASLTEAAGGRRAFRLKHPKRITPLHGPSMTPVARSIAAE